MTIQLLVDYIEKRINQIDKDRKIFKDKYPYLYSQNKETNYNKKQKSKNIMKIISSIVVTLTLLIAFTAYAASSTHKKEVIRIIDGDTFEISTKQESLMINELKLMVRIKGVDTPEKKGKCQKEKDLALAANNFISKLLLGKKVQLTDIEWDKFGGRILANVSIDGLDVSKELISNGLAIQYNGEKKTKDWCK